MTKPLRFDDEATEEMNTAAEWYEARRKNLGIEFVAEVRQVLATIASAPETWTLIPEVDKHLGALARRSPLGRVSFDLWQDAHREGLREEADAKARARPQRGSAIERPVPDAQGLERHRANSR